MTVYFINESINAENSGIEHAEFDRARLFRQNHVAFKIVTTTYNQDLHHVLPMFNLRDKESCNMFEYFCDTLSVKAQKLELDDIDFGVDVTLTKNDNVYTADVNGHVLGRIVTNSLDIITRAEYFEGQGNLYRVDNFDSRGFVSLRQYYSPDNHVEVEQWLDITGKIIVEKTFTVNRSGKFIESWQVNSLVFNNIQSLRKYFYDCLNQTGKNMFMIDRTNVAEWQLTQLKRPAYLVFILHNHQTSDATNPEAPLLNNNYEWSLANIDKWNCIVSSTPQQTRDLKRRWKTKGRKYVTVPVGVISQAQLTKPHIKMSARKPHSMLVTARVAREKGVDKMIEALAIAQKTIPDLTLDIYGYIDHGDDNIASKRITEAKKDLVTPDSVTLHGHTKDVESLHEQYQVYLIYSTMEGFNLALMEAQSSGMVGLTNNVYYGPNELIKDGKNGYIVGYNDVDAYAKQMVALFSDDKKLQKMSDQAYKLSDRYSSENVFTAWQPVLDDFAAWQKEG